jgi:hypothetical protein
VFWRYTFNREAKLKIAVCLAVLMLAVGLAELHTRLQVQVMPVGVRTGPICEMYGPPVASDVTHR